MADWDAIGTQAFTAAALSPAEGHTIFAYVAIAVYDSVMAVEGGYEPFAVDVDAPDGRLGRSRGGRGGPSHPRPLPARRRPRSSTRPTPPRWPPSLTARPKTDGVATGEKVADLPHCPAGRRWLPGAGDVHAAEPADPRGLDPDGAHAADRPLPRSDAARSASTQPTSSDRDGPPPLRSKRWARDYNEVKEIGSSTSTTRTAEQTLAARFWAEPPVQQARGSFRKFVLDHELDVARGGTVHGDDLGDLRRCPHRLLRRQVPLRVLAADHRHPGRRHRRQRRDRRRPGVDAAPARHAEPPGVPERALLRHTCRRDASSPGSSGRRGSTSPSPA